MVFLEILVKPSKILIRIESPSNKSLRQKLQSIYKLIFNISSEYRPYFNVHKKKNTKGKIKKKQKQNLKNHSLIFVYNIFFLNARENNFY